MDVRSIIEAAKEDVREVFRHTFPSAFRTSPDPTPSYERLMDFLEHVALMEAVVEADDPEPPKFNGDPSEPLLTDLWVAWYERQKRRDALTTYRRDHKGVTG